MTGRDTDERAGGVDPFREWDAAYVLGSLDPADRRAFEDHLRTCAACRAAVAELAGMPGLLRMVPAQEATTLGGPPVAEVVELASVARDGEQPGADRLLGALQHLRVPPQPQQRLLDDVLRVADAPEHPVRDRERHGPQLLVRGGGNGHDAATPSQRLG
jgi:anti-sigma factor RsiW